jgi:23S rRNA U2552 (ribose-2'-O)-methylase RlmE/FtsJ
MYPAELALEMAQTLLKPDGSALIKLLQGAGFETYLLASGKRMV